MKAFPALAALALAALALAACHKSNGASMAPAEAAAVTQAADASVNAQGRPAALNAVAAVTPPAQAAAGPPSVVLGQGGDGAPDATLDAHPVPGK